MSAGATWCVMSDVHGNVQALDRAIEYARARGVERFAFLGDALGDTADSDSECLRLLMNTVQIAVFGNRELRVRLAVGDEFKTWLRSLPATHVAEGAHYCHASPAGEFPHNATAADALVLKRRRSYFKLFPYISGRSAVLAAARALPERATVCLHGHTHKQALWLLRDGEPERLGGRSASAGDGVLIAGVGSVGEGERGRVEFALYRPSDRAVELVSLE
ncbi:MAG: metallophosphoesterase family protein [Chloroflexia bacterium]